MRSRRSSSASALLGRYIARQLHRQLATAMGVVVPNGTAEPRRRLLSGRQYALVLAGQMVDYDDLADRLALHELVSRHGHCVDAGDFAGLTQVFTHDVVYDVSEMGGEPLIGLGAVEHAALALGERNPLGHHVTNIVVEDLRPTRARVVSKALGVTTDGKVGSVVYEDDAIRTELGWRIERRLIRPRRRPLQR